MDFIPRDLEHDYMFNSARASEIRLSVISGCGSAVGGPTNSTKAKLVGRASRKPKCVADAENRVRMERLARQETERKENKPKPIVDEVVLQRASEVWSDAVGKYMTLGRAVSRRERVETLKEGEEWDESLTYSATPHEVIASLILRIRSYYGNPTITSVGELKGGEGMLQENFEAENSLDNEKEEKAADVVEADEVSSGSLGRGGLFFDLGCGVGGVVTAAASVHCWDEVVGIECLEGLHNTALEVKQMWEKVEVTRALGDDYERGVHEGLNKVRFVRGNFFDLDDCDWTVGDVVFCNCAMFTTEKMTELQNAALGLRPGSFLFTVTKGLDESTSDFALVEERTVKMDYGGGTVFMYVRTAEEESIEGGGSVGGSVGGSIGGSVAPVDDEAEY